MSGDRWPMFGRFTLGLSMVGNRPLYGTTVRCSACRWRMRANVAPSNGGKRTLQHEFNAHVCEGPKP